MMYDLMIEQWEDDLTFIQFIKRCEKQEMELLKESEE